MHLTRRRGPMPDEHVDTGKPDHGQEQADVDSAPFQSMRNALEAWVALSAEQWRTLATIFHARTVERQAYLLLPGDDVHEILFVHEGLLRFYYAGDEGTESNKAFIAEGTFAGPLAAAALRLPVMYGVQALEPTTLLAASYEDFAALFEHDPVFDRLGRKFAERLLTRKELRTRSLLQRDARERYLDFVEHHPDIVQRVPQYHIASYLGITEVHLSRLRRLVAEQEQAAR